MAQTVERSHVAIVTGTSRDVGEFTAYGLGQAGWNILGLYRNPQHEADQVSIIGKLKDYKVKMSAVRADLVDKATPQLMVKALEEHFNGEAGGLLLGAAGGYNRPTEEARKINVDSQLRLVDALKSHLVAGSNIVFDTSDPAHRYRLLKAAGVDLGEYEPVAQTKNEFEMILRSREHELRDRGIGIVINVANALEGTFVTRVLKGSRRTRDMVSTWLNTTENGLFPIALEMAVANVKALRGEFPSSHTEYVGIKPEYQLYPSRHPRLALVGAPPMMEGSILSREKIEEVIPHRWPFSFIGGVESIEYGQRATGWLVDLTHPDINWRQGHFPGFEVVPGVITQEALQQLGALTALGAPEHKGKIAVLTAVEEMRFRRPIKPGEDIRLAVEMTQTKESRGITFGRAALRATNTNNKVTVEGNISFSLLNPPS